jgi:hypothetical protein
MRQVLVIASLILSVLLLSQPAEAFSLWRRVNESTSWLCDTLHFEFDSMSNDIVIGQLNSYLQEISICKPQFRLWFWQQPKSSQIYELHQLQWIGRMRIYDLKIKDEKRRNEIEMKLKWNCESIIRDFDFWSKNDSDLVKLSHQIQSNPLCHPGFRILPWNKPQSGYLNELEQVRRLGDTRISILKQKALNDFELRFQWICESSKYGFDVWINDPFIGQLKSQLEQNPLCITGSLNWLDSRSQLIEELEQVAWLGKFRISILKWKEAKKRYEIDLIRKKSEFEQIFLSTINFVLFLFSPRFFEAFKVYTRLSIWILLRITATLKILLLSAVKALRKFLRNIFGLLFSICEQLCVSLFKYCFDLLQKAILTMILFSFVIAIFIAGYMNQFTTQNNVSAEDKEDSEEKEEARDVSTVSVADDSIVQAKEAGQEKELIKDLSTTSVAEYLAAEDEEAGEENESRDVLTTSVTGDFPAEYEEAGEEIEARDVLTTSVTGDFPAEYEETGEEIEARDTLTASITGEFSAENEEAGEVMDDSVHLDSALEVIPVSWNGQSFDVLEILGQGSFCQCFKICKAGKLYAAKVFSKEKYFSDKALYEKV